MEREIIFWDLERGELSLYDWLEKWKHRMVTYSITRFEDVRGTNSTIASQAIGILETNDFG